MSEPIVRMTFPRHVTNGQRLRFVSDGLAFEFEFVQADAIDATRVSHRRDGVTMTHEMASGGTLSRTLPAGFTASAEPSTVGDAVARSAVPAMDPAALRRPTATELPHGLEPMGPLPWAATLLRAVLACELAHDANGHAYLKVPARSIYDLAANIRMFVNEFGDAEAGDRADGPAESGGYDPAEVYAGADLEPLVERCKVGSPVHAMLVRHGVLVELVKAPAGQDRPHPFEPRAVLPGGRESVICKCGRFKGEPVHDPAPDSQKAA